MKIPNKIKIGGNIYDIVYTDNFDLGKANVNGVICYQERQIKILPDLSESEKQLTFIHEVIHGILHFMCEKENNDNEQLVEKITQIINMFIVDNSDILTKNCKCGGDCKSKQEQNSIKQKDNTDDINFKRKKANEDFYVIRVDNGKFVISPCSEIFSAYCDRCYRNNNYFLSRKHAQEAIDKINFILLSQRKLEAIEHEND